MPILAAAETLSVVFTWPVHPLRGMSHCCLSRLSTWPPPSNLSHSRHVACPTAATWPVPQPPRDLSHSRHVTCPTAATWHVPQPPRDMSHSRHVTCPNAATWPVPPPLRGLPHLCHVFKTMTSPSTVTWLAQAPPLEPPRVLSLSAATGTLQTAASRVPSPPETGLFTAVVPHSSS